MAVVVSDTSPIRALAFLKRLDLLAELFGTVLIPPAVAEELERPPPDLVVVRPALLPFVTIRAPTDVDRVRALLVELDRGEAEALCLAIEERISTVLIDEAAGRAAAVGRPDRTTPPHVCGPHTTRSKHYIGG